MENQIESNQSSTEQVNDLRAKLIAQLREKTPTQVQQNYDFLYEKTVKFVHKYQAYLIALFISFLSCLFFLIISQPDLFSWFAGFSQRWTGLLILGLCLIFTYIFCFTRGLPLHRSAAIFIQSNVLTFFSFAYFLGIDKAYITNFQLFNKFFVLDTSIVFVPLVILIFLVNLNLFGKNQRKLYLQLPQVALFSVHIFSFLSLLRLDRTEVRTFSSDFIAKLLTINPILWLFLGSLAITLISILSLELTKRKQIFLFSSLYFVFVFQMLVAINGLRMFSITYWHKTLIFLIFWDFLYLPMYIVAKRVLEENFQPKILVSLIYHIVLILLVIFSSFIF